MENVRDLMKLMGKGHNSSVTMGRTGISFDLDLAETPSADLLRGKPVFDHGGRHKVTIKVANNDQIHQKVRDLLDVLKVDKYVPNPEITEIVARKPEEKITPAEIIKMKVALGLELQQ